MAEATIHIYSLAILVGARTHCRHHYYYGDSEILNTRLTIVTIPKTKAFTDDVVNDITTLQTDPQWATGQTPLMAHF